MCLYMYMDDNVIKTVRFTGLCEASTSQCWQDAGCGASGPSDQCSTTYASSVGEKPLAWESNFGFDFTCMKCRSSYYALNQ